MSRTFENHAPTALVRKLEAIAPLSDAERAAILGENAARLLLLG